jgi:hypothetical protein
MREPYNSRRPPPHPEAGDPIGALPADRLSRSVSVKLDPEERQVLEKCRRLLADRDGSTYPTTSRVLRLALSTLYWTLTRRPPTKEVDSEPAP